MERLISCAEAKQIDLIFYLAELGFTPQKIRNHEYWYLSPLREEKTASFKVDKNKNLWYDHGDGRGGSLIDFGILFHRCSVRDFLRMLGTKGDAYLSFHPPFSKGKASPEAPYSRLQVLRAEPLTDIRLFNYLMERCVSLEIAQRYLQQVTFRIIEKEQVALGFLNDKGGFELRNIYFKGSASPKDVTTIGERRSRRSSLAVFEGFFSFLSYLTLRHNESHERWPEMDRMESHFLVLNSLAFFEKSRSLMEQHKRIHLYLDRDDAGLAATQKALQWSHKYHDQSTQYLAHKDLNDYLVQRRQQQQDLLPKPQFRSGRHL